MEAKVKVGVFADREVGQQAVQFLLDNYPDDLSVVVCTDESSLVYQELQKQGISAGIFLFHRQLQEKQIIESLRTSSLDYIILAWWPYIIKDPILSIAKKGILNFHPSLLPYNRGKHYNFWTIVEETDFGVTIHFVDSSVDGGDIVFQKRILKDWTDTGGTLYYKAQNAMAKLFEESYPLLRQENYQRIPQKKDEGSFHFGKELEAASQIDLNKTYTGREILNLLRARTFESHPAAWFTDDDRKYEVKVSIKKIS